MLALSLAVLFVSCGGEGEGGSGVCTEHRDANDDGKCDTCEVDYRDGDECDHKDANDDLKCDACGKDYDDGKEIAAGTIYSDRVFPAIVHKSGEIPFALDEILTVQGYMRDNASISPSVFKDDGIVFKHEIVFGDTNRVISATAKDILTDNIAKESEECGEDVTGYLIYSDGNSVALVWSDFQIADVAISYFLENYLSDEELILEEGFTKTEYLPNLLDYLAEREERILGEQWATLEANIPEKYREEVITELGRIYALYDDKAVSWIASLYDPETGGFYAAQSAKEVGLPTYGPDIEHTFYGFSVIGATGMGEMFDNDWIKAAPQDLLLKAATWIQSLQREDGYFHHPQWPNPSDLRLTRDIGTAKRMIRAAGLPVLYSNATPSENNLLGKLNGSTVTAVSKVVAVSEALSHFESVETFKAHLDGWEAELKNSSDSNRAWLFYLWGSTFQSTAGYIKANPEYVRMTVEFFDKHQNPENGVWSQNIYLNSTNAIHKIGSVYNSLGAEIKYVDKMMETTLALLNDMPYTETTCEIYNVWSCFQYIYINVRNYSSGTAEERAARCEAYKERAYPDIVRAIRTTYDHLIHYRYEDASFSYYRGYSLYAAQGAPTAVRGTKEGDIAGYLLAIESMPYYIIASMELEEYIVRPFTEEDRVRYIEALHNVGKTPELDITVTNPVTYGFENDTVGEAPSSVEVAADSFKEAASGTYVKVVDDGEGGKMLEYNAVASASSSKGNYVISVNANHTSEEPDALSLSFKIKVDTTSAQSSKLIELSVKDALTEKSLVKLYIGRSLSILNLYDASGNKIAKLGNAGNLIDVKIDYNLSTGAYSMTAVGTVIAEGTLKAMNVPGSFSIMTPSDTKSKFYLDDICFKTFKSE